MANIKKSFEAASTGSLLSAELLMTLAKQMVSKAFLSRPVEPMSDYDTLLSRAFQLRDTALDLGYEQDWTFA